MLNDLTACFGLNQQKTIYAIQRGDSLVFKNPSYESILKTWYKDNGKEFTGEWDRADLYLLVNALTTHGTKLREGKLEIKVMSHDWGILDLYGNNSGKANMWTKYGFELNAGDAETSQVLRSFAGPRVIGINHDWIRIDKERLLIKYDVDPDQGVAKKVNELERTGQGCYVEFSRLNINLREEYFTFNFEAFGKGVDLRKNLDLTLAAVFTELGLTGLDAAESQSFPEFISGLA